MPGAGPLPAATFDQRPGLFEATRVEPASGLIVCGSRDHRRNGGGWSVLASVRGEDGSFCQVALTPADARKAARELVDMAELLEGHVW